MMPQEPQDDYFISGDTESEILEDYYTDLALEWENKPLRNQRPRSAKRQFAATIDGVCTRSNPEDQSRTQILLIKNRDSFYLPNDFKAYVGEKAEVAFVRGLCNIFSLG
jgi:hypothetical protein